MEQMHSQLVFSRPAAAATVTPTISPALKSKEVAPFLKNLRRILEVESREILRWTDDGKAFEIHDLQRMMDVVLPKYFKHAKYTSFQRQLNYFNFRKWTKSKAVVCTFSNPFFVRDQPYLAWRINRKKSLHHSSSSSSSSSAASASAAAGSPAKRSARRAAGGSRHKSHAMVIKVPARSDAEPSRRLPLSPFPSPTDASAMHSELTASDEMLDEVAALFAADVSPVAAERDDELLRGESLDWVDALYSSLNASSASCAAVPSFQDHALDFCAQV